MTVFSVSFAVPAKSSDRRSSGRLSAGRHCHPLPVVASPIEHRGDNATQARSPGSADNLDSSSDTRSETRTDPPVVSRQALEGTRARCSHAPRILTPCWLLSGKALPFGADVRRNLTPVKKTSIVEDVAKSIRRSIIEGYLAAGEPFSIRELSAQLGVSHIPVREALRKLEVEGLITFRLSRSAIVTPLDVNELKAIFRLRKLLEPRLALESHPLLDREALKRAHVYAPKNGHQTDEHNEFHLLFLRPAATVWDLRIVKMLWNAYERYSSNVLVGDEDERRRIEQNHFLLLETAMSDSAIQLAEVVYEHIEESERMILSALEVHQNGPAL